MLLESKCSRKNTMQRLVREGIISLKIIVSIEANFLGVNVLQKLHHTLIVGVRNIDTSIALCHYITKHGVENRPYNCQQEPMSGDHHLFGLLSWTFMRDKGTANLTSLNLLLIDKELAHSWLELATPNIAKCFLQFFTALPEM